MLYALGSLLPEYRVKAYNNGVGSNNLIHDDEHARRHGFRAGLVPGTSIFAYMCRSLVGFMGKEWLERGYAEVRFVHPIYEGEEVRVTGSLASISKEGTLCADLQAINNHGITCSIGTARLPTQTPRPEPTLEDYPAGHGKPKRPLSLETLKTGECLTPVTSEFTWNIHWEYCQKSIRDHHPVYHQILHPGWLLSQANLILAENYALGPWIHVSSAIQNYHLQDRECLVETRGRVLDKFERGGHHFIVLDLAIFASGHCLETVCHTAIFRIAPKAA
ncbi:MAG TPA: MaoC family dehydratase [Acidobacteriota bacterium]|nr:MaoC family dehydratase [Acidobacteriota bacterium]